MIMAIFVILMTTKLKSTQRNLMQYSFLRKLVKSIHFLELFVSFVSLCTVRGLHFSEDSFTFNLLRPEVRPFVSVPRYLHPWAVGAIRVSNQQI